MRDSACRTDYHSPQASVDSADDRRPGVQPLDGYTQVAVIGNCVTSAHGLRLVVRRLHRDRAGYARAFEVADGRSV